MRSLVLVLAVFLAACCLPEVKDETAGWSANKLYTEARDAMNEGSYDRAIKYFEQLEARYPFGRYAQQAQLEVAYAYYRNYDPASALSACDRFIKLHPNHPNVDYAYYLKGLIHFNEDQSLFARLGSQDQSERDPKAARESFDTFKELVTRYPESKYAPDASARMRHLVNSLALHEVHVARYYLNRGAFVASANRAQYAVQTYPDAPAREEALYILTRAYDAMGLGELRDDARRVLTQNYPNSAYLARGFAAKPWWKLW